MAKYEKFGPFLARQRGREVKMAFAEIERVLGAPLPPSAYKHRPWWSNNPSNNALTKAWVEAGYETTQVDMAAHRLVFRRVAKADPPAEPGQRIRQLFGSLKGLLQIEDGYDVSGPALPDWGRDLEAKYGPVEAAWRGHESSGPPLPAVGARRQAASGSDQAKSGEPQRRGGEGPRR